MSRIARDCVWEGLVAHLDAGVTRGRRALGDESETLVRLLAGAQRVISKDLGDSRFSNAAVSREDPRRPLFASRLQTRRPVASGPLASAGHEQGALGAGGSALLIAESSAHTAAGRIDQLHM
jgi:hypothetical protein